MEHEIEQNTMTLTIIQNLITVTVIVIIIWHNSNFGSEHEKFKI